MSGSDHDYYLLHVIWADPAITKPCFLELVFTLFYERASTFYTQDASQNGDFSVRNKVLI